MTLEASRSTVARSASFGRQVRAAGARVRAGCSDAERRRRTPGRGLCACKVARMASSSRPREESTDLSAAHLTDRRSVLGRARRAVTVPVLDAYSRDRRESRMGALRLPPGLARRTERAADGLLLRHPRPVRDDAHADFESHGRRSRRPQVPQAIGTGGRYVRRAEGGLISRAPEVGGAGLEPATSCL